MTRRLKRKFQETYHVANVSPYHMVSSDVYKTNSTSNSHEDMVSSTNRAGQV